MRLLARGLAAALLLGTCLAGAPPPAQAQLVLVSGDYRIVDFDQADQRVGVALPDARPDVRQNWAYIEPSTDITRRVRNRDGWFKDVKLNYYEFFALKSLKGKVVTIHGGRRWDTGISAKQIWIDCAPIE